MGAILVTGAAGFVGSHVAEALLQRGERVVGLDNFDPYYRREIKRRNVARLALYPDFSIHEIDLRQAEGVKNLVRAQGADRIVHLAALAGVRASIERASDYHAVNTGGTIHLLDAAREAGVRQFVFVSTSSVYGATSRIPFVEDDSADRPLAPYPASKRAAEMMCHAYHNMFGLNVTCVRLFTVYGPRVRPDLMVYQLAESTQTGKAVTLFDDGQLKRDWTYVGDIVPGIVAALDTPLGYEIVNLGRGEPVLLADFVRLIEQRAGKKVNLVHRPAPASEPRITFANVDKARRLFGYDPKVSVEAGIEYFWQWYKMEIGD